MLKVRDVMAKEFVSVPRSAPIGEVARKMKDLKTGAVPVCDNGKLRGIITERDIVIGVANIAGNISNLPARLLMNNHHPIISPGEDILQAAKVMVNNGVRVLPVAQNGKFLGLFTLDDLARESLALASMVFSKTIKLGQRKGGSR
jgi:CBS domain-containing protein